MFDVDSSAYPEMVITVQCAFGIVKFCGIHGFNGLSAITNFIVTQFNAQQVGIELAIWLSFVQTINHVK